MSEAIMAVRTAFILNDGTLVYNQTEATKYAHLRSAALDDMINSLIRQYSKETIMGKTTLIVILESLSEIRIYNDINTKDLPPSMNWFINYPFTRAYI